MEMVIIPYCSKVNWRVQLVLTGLMKKIKLVK